MHTLDRQAEQLKLSKVSFKRVLFKLALQKKQNKRKIALIVPGGSKKDFIKEYQLKFFDDNKILNC